MRETVSEQKMKLSRFTNHVLVSHGAPLTSHKTSGKFYWCRRKNNIRHCWKAHIHAKTNKHTQDHFTKFITLLCFLYELVDAMTLFSTHCISHKYHVNQSNPRADSCFPTLSSNFSYFGVKVYFFLSSKELEATVSLSCFFSLHSCVIRWRILGAWNEPCYTM